MKDLNMLVIKAILDLPENHNTYFTQLKPCFDHLLPLIRNYIKSKESQNDCLSSLEEYCLSQADRLTPLVLVKVIAYLYDAEVLKEDVILEWYKNAKPLAEFDLEEQETLRSQKPILNFIKWLQEAEEESSSEESE